MRDLDQLEEERGRAERGRKKEREERCTFDFLQRVIESG